MASRSDHARYAPAAIPEHPTPCLLHAAAQGCRACDLYAGATQAVLGEGPPGARVMLVGEQPGDREDIEGHPFVGPAGRVLDQALARAGIARDDVYATNAVKHFRHRTHGTRRIRKRPDRWQVQACQPWLEAEIALVAPRAVVALGATAARTLIGPGVRVGTARGRPAESDVAELVTVTVHPSTVLRAGARSERHRAMDALVDDLAMVAGWLARTAVGDHAPEARSASGPSGS